MHFTDADKALIKAKVATLRHAKSAHLWRKAVLLRAMELKAPKQTLPAETLPLFQEARQ